MSTLAGIHLFPLQSTVHFQKTFVSNTTIQRQAANKSPFKAVYPLINANNLKNNIYTVVKDICVIVVSIMDAKKLKKNVNLRPPCNVPQKQGEIRLF